MSDLTSAQRNNEIDDAPIFFPGCVKSLSATILIPIVGMDIKAKH